MGCEFMSFMEVISMKITFLLTLIFFITGCSTVIEAPTLETDEGVDVVPDESEIVEEDHVEVEPEPEPEQRVSFFSLGDNLIHSFVYRYAHVGNGVYDFTPIYKNLATDIQEADIAYINQETVLGGDHKGFSGYPNFNTPSGMSNSLAELGFDIVNGNNNHALDMGTDGLLNSLAYWAEFGDDVLFTGTFESQEHRDTIPVLERDGVKISFLTYTYGTNSHVREASYQINYFDPELITEDVKRAQELSDFVVLAAHWGDEYSMVPNQMQLDYAQLFADLEVDVVLGSHPHTIQPIEWVTGKTGHETLVIYSLGDVVSSAVKDITLLGGSVSFDLVKVGKDKSIENVHFEPNVNHYEASTPGNINTRTNFEVIKLKDYTHELEQRHALNGHEGNVVTYDYFIGIVNEVISEEFR